MSNFYRNRYHTQKSDTQNVNSVLEAMLKMSKSRPTRKSDFIMYSEIYYESRVKPGFDAMWAACLLNGIPGKERINLWSKYTREHWSKEPKEIKDEVKKRSDEEFAAQMQEWKDRAEWTESPEAFDA